MPRNIETLEDFDFFMQVVYEMNPDKTKEEIDAVILKDLEVDI